MGGNQKGFIMRISSLSIFQLNNTGKKLNKTFNQLSTGKRINSPADDPAGSALANSLASATRGLNVINRGLSQTQSTLNVASGALSQSTEGLQRLRELAVQAANGTLSDN